MKCFLLIFLFCCTLPARGTLKITEFVANPADIFADSDGDFPDWIELQNTGAGNLSTAGYKLSDDPDFLNRWPLPSVDLAPGEFLIIFASEKNRAVAGEELHSNFKLSQDPNFLGLVDPAGELASRFHYPKQAYGMSYGQGGFHTTPTPGATNGTADFPDYVRDTKFSKNRGFYTASFSLVITSATPAAAIYYTTDGSEPSLTNGTLYTSPIHITTTTVIRAIATKEGLLSSNIDAQSYFFLQDVITQPAAPAGFPATWGIDNSTSNGATNLPRPSDYEMDQRVITQFGATEAIEALKNHPTISVVMDPDHLWNESSDSATGGIYPNPYGGTGDQFLAGWGEPREWERPCSVEFIGFEKVPELQVNAGIRIAGNFARHPNRYKHHFRLTSRREYGPSKFKGELFSRTDVDTFDDFILRGGNSEAWTFPGASGNGPGTRSNVQYLRDQFYKDAQVDMGHLSAHFEYFHLYLNGAYWGFYSLIERVDAHFLSQHLGGKEEDFDVIKQANVLSDGSHDDWEAMYAISRAGVSDAASYEAIQEYLDLDNFIDYMIFNFWAGTVDWRNNWRAGRRSRGADDYGFQFYNWDGERGLGDNGGNRTYTFNSTTSSRSWSYHPNEMHHALKLNPEYQIRFADRVQKHLFHNGTLSPQRAALLYNARAEEVRPALIVESARWGDRQRPSDPYTTENEWQMMLDYLNDVFFPLRNPIVINQFRTERIYPTIDAPTFNQHGGMVTNDFPLLISASSGTIYYTTDGSDPRLEGGAISPTALISSGGSEESEIISSGSIWNYNDDDLAIAANWSSPSFDDSLWKAGPSPLGYGGVSNTTIATTLVGTPITTAYFRKQFEITDPASVISSYLDASLDGGGIFYLNGIEIFRENMADGPVDHTTLSTSDGVEGVFDRFEVPTEHLVTGTNTLSIEVHNRSSQSSDMALDIRMVIAEITEPDLNISSAQTIRTRALDGTNWSALTEAFFYIGDLATSENLVIAEILYKPFVADSDEFIELLNISSSPVSLAGVRFDKGIDYEFGQDVILSPGERLVLTPSDYEGRLSNAGERILLLAADGSAIADFNYGIIHPWPPATFQGGGSIVLSHPTSKPNPDLPENWVPSLTLTGTPGTSDTISPPIGANLRDFFFDGKDPEITFSNGSPLFILPRNLAADGARIVIEVSEDLISWQEGGSYQGFVTLPDQQAAMTWALSLDPGRQFVRARVIVDP